MYSPFIIDAAEIGLAALGVVGIRGLFARAAVQTACREAKPAVEEFKRNNNSVEPMREEFRAAATELLDTVHSSQETRASVIARMKDIKVPNPGVPDMLPALQVTLERAQTSLLVSLKQTYKYKTTKLVRGEVKKRLAKVGKKAASTAHHAADTGDQAADTAHQVVGDAAHHLSGVEQGMVNILDDVGVIGAAEWGAEHLLHGASKVVGEDAAHEAINVIGGFWEDVSFPGLISGTKAMFREFKLLKNDQTSFGDSLQHGLIPVAGRSLLTSIGVMIDSSFGWATLGAFTIGLSWLGKHISNELLVSEVKDQIDQLKHHMGIIKTRQDQALRSINSSVATHLVNFTAKVEACPDIGDEPAIKKFVDKLHQGYKSGMEEANSRLVDSTQQTINALPQRNWVDKILFIDRSAEVSKLYWAATRQVQSVNLGVVNEFSKSAEIHPEQVVRFVLAQPTFRNSGTTDALKTMAETRIESSVTYAGSLTRWEGGCLETWSKGAKNIAEVTAEEHKGLSIVAAEQNEAMRPIRKKIDALKVRLKQKNVDD